MVQRNEFRLLSIVTESEHALWNAVLQTCNNWTEGNLVVKRALYSKNMAQWMLDPFLKGRIIRCLEAGQTQIEVSAALNVPLSVIFRLWRKFQGTGDVHCRPVQGRPRVTTSQQDRYLISPDSVCKMIPLEYSSGENVEHDYIPGTSWKWISLRWWNIAACRHHVEWTYGTAPLQQRSDVVLLCFSITNPVSLRNCKVMWYPEIRRFCPQTPVLLVGCKNDLRYMYRDETYLSFFRDRSPFVRPTRKSDLVMPDQARAIAKELGIYYYETSVLTYYGVNEVFENAIRAALIARRQQRFWMTNLKKVQRPLLQAPFRPPKPPTPELHVAASTYAENMQSLWLQQAYTDVILVAGSVGFSAHRFILAAASPAFHRLLMMDLSSELGARSSSESSMVSTFGEATMGEFNDDTEYLIRQSDNYFKPSRMGDSLCPIEQLLKHPFRLHSLQEKLNIILSDRPCPEMPTLFAAHKDKGKDYTRHFQASRYQKTQWIAGSAKLNKLFCWPCLMFSKEETVWSKNGYDNLNNLHNAINKHEKSQTHIFSVLQFKSFGSSRIDVQLDSQLHVSVEQHNEMVRKNREILKRLIDTVCFLAMHELSFRGHCESEEAVNKEVYLGALNYLAKYDNPQPSSGNFYHIPRNFKSNTE
ncbi:hypothetical protein ANN_01075 [Periplaneta americana]|uniref:BTB domain-containing protein n=1 Tax=Periplaneta americana TaxID=6978 RepID=A0ABQ8TV07_PERAM|nr:hypothetical protein ANN_01075 [Periplaneta americana]